MQAGDSDSNDAADDAGPTETGEKPNDKELSREAILPGYNHLDVATAAWRQNDGRPGGLEPRARPLHAEGRRAGR